MNVARPLRQILDETSRFEECVPELATHLDYKQLGVIHDEIQIECSPDDAEEIGKLTVKAMELTTDYYKLRCPISGEYKIGRSWNETH